TIEVEEEVFDTEASGTSVEHTVALSAGGASVELSMGSGESSSLTISTGRSMMVSGTIPGMAAAYPAYKVGLFTYLHRAGDPDAPDGQVFQVVNYWVE